MRKIPHWLEEFSPAESLDILRDLAYSHACEGGALGQKIAELIRRSDFKALVEFEIDYSDPSLSAHAVKHCRQALAFFSKLPDLKIGIDKDEVALRKFLEAEELCRQTNSILNMCREGRLSWPNRVNSVFHAAQRKIARILGPVPSLSQLDLRFGPGATLGVKRSEASNRSKIAEVPQCSEELLPIAAMLLEELPHLRDLHSVGDRIEMTDVEDDDWQDYVEAESLHSRASQPDFYNRSGKGGLVIDEWALVPVEITPARLNFVPKNAKTHRSVCVEAGLNVIFQLAVGTHMAKRLAAYGIDIRDQSLNQRRALEGSLTGALATLDLSSASDTISREIVYELLPLEWAELLNWGRSSKVVLPNGDIITQEKFSSMGNGYTFPLETLIFWGLAAACCGRDSDATVYGDDIVVPTSAFDLLREVLHYAGFVVNVGKSFSTGPFRESCGKDYFRGIDVRPFYMKGWVNAQALFVLHNFYVRRGEFERSKEVENFIHPDLRLVGPDGYGDGHLIGEHPKDRPAKYVARGYSGYFFNTFTTKGRKDLSPQPGDYVLPLYVIYRRGEGDIIAGGSLPVKVENPDDEETRSSYLRKLVRAMKIPVVRSAPLPLPEEGGTKALTLPGTDGYKKIKIYTLGG